ncbi:MAG TPA: asparagine synthetase B, partial [Bacteroidales bacterium]|nr:asparagine synthetase B [Bacteroidales bacterium]
MKRIFLICFICIVGLQSAGAFGLFIPMDNTQKNHLKAYGLTYWVLQHDMEVQWLLNYRGGSFLIEFNQSIKQECEIRGISYEIIP